jgi:rare lipoprotein A
VIAIPVTATGDGITVTTNVSALLGRALAFTGVTAPTSAGDTIVVQRLDSQVGWVSVSTGTVAIGGAFSVLWHTNHAGHVTIRTVLEQAASASQTGQVSPTLQITVFRPAVATYYGKGFFGHRTACGTILRHATLGVASRTLKCGTPVQIYYGGRSIVVPVIDRGPYANNATWDLTQATAQALGMLGTETVGAMPV